MGGQNHQPCNRYLKNSTKLSRSLSCARASLELANVALEDIILAELDGDVGEAFKLKSELEKSIMALSETKISCSKLFDQMIADKYVDLPPFKTLDFVSMGTALERDGIVSRDAWGDVVEWNKKKGFFGALNKIIDSIEELSELTEALLSKIENIDILILSGELEKNIEMNGPGNFKKEFAKLYQKWHWFGERFLASSIFSTEIWYKFNEYPSISRNLSKLRIA
ncbi:MAG: hypothetical protein H6883_02650 [Rhodobiaceae bacterium]|nr:hypothetical protein [Rhodobiaceae bacterium]MCC0055018.1 hypothetical protein [Rhodobiaceae bacterium]